MVICQYATRLALVQGRMIFMAFLGTFSVKCLKLLVWVITIELELLTGWNFKQLFIGFVAIVFKVEETWRKLFVLKYRDDLDFEFNLTLFRSLDQLLI